MTYGALGARSQLPSLIACCCAVSLRAAVVGVLTGRSANLPAAVLGIWKAGATYLPLAADLAARSGWPSWPAMPESAHLIALDGLAVAALALPPALRPEELDAEFRRTHEHRPPPSCWPQRRRLHHLHLGLHRPAKGHADRP